MGGPRIDTASVNSVAARTDTASFAPGIEYYQRVKHYGSSWPLEGVARLGSLPRTGPVRSYYRIIDNRASSVLRPSASLENSDRI
jgi:hypothetical protein